jgi:hypothetical protein
VGIVKKYVSGTRNCVSGFASVKSVGIVKKYVSGTGNCVSGIASIKSVGIVRKYVSGTGKWQLLNWWRRNRYLVLGKIEAGAEHVQ